MRSARRDSDDVMHSESWTHKIHQQPFWTCQGPHEGDSLYSFPTKKGLTDHTATRHTLQLRGSGRARHGSPDQTTEWTTHELMPEAAKTGKASKQLLSQLTEKYAAKTQRPASACPLCMRDPEKEESRKLQDGKASFGRQMSSNALLTDDAIAPPELWRHIAGHLHDLMVLSLQLMTTAARVDDDSSNTKLSGSLPNRASEGPVGRGVNDSRFPNLPSDLLRPSTRESRPERGPSPSTLRSGLPSEGTTSSPVGLKVLHDRPDAVVDICFVHGLTGDRETTWAAPGHEPWPITLLPSELQARILTYGYHAYAARASPGPSSNRLMAHAANLLRDLTAERARGVERPLTFIAHSIGGLVCKEAMLHSWHSSEAHFRRISECTKGIVFMGTPHKGAPTADWARIPASALGVARGVKESLLDILETENKALESLHQGNSSMVRELQLDGRNPRATCFFEELPLPGIGGVVVSGGSAAFGSGDPIAITANHGDIVRFTSAEDVGFGRLLGELRQWEPEVKRGEQSAPGRD